MAKAGAAEHAPCRRCAADPAAACCVCVKEQYITVIRAPFCIVRATAGLLAQWQRRSAAEVCRQPSSIACRTFKALGTQSSSQGAVSPPMRPPPSTLPPPPPPLPQSLPQPPPAFPTLSSICLLPPCDRRHGLGLKPLHCSAGC